MHHSARQSCPDSARPARARRWLAALLAVWLPLAQGSAWAADSLPELGASSLSPQQELQLGRDVMRQIRSQGGVVDDPLLTEYLNAIGDRLVAASGDQGQHFDFFLVKDDSINAFALPGGYIGVNYGLWLQTSNESELAGVMAHEVAHVTQHHIARQYQASKGMGLKTLAAILGAVLIGASGKGGPDAAQAAVAAATAGSIQQQIDYTRANEYEADRVGIGILAAAGYDPQGMVDFFKLMEQRFHFETANLPEFMSNHPLSTHRITEAAERARRLSQGPYRESRQYGIMCARLRVLASNNLQDVYAHFAAGARDDASLSERYGRALAAIRLDRHQEATRLMQALVKEAPDTIAFHIGLAEAQFGADEPGAAMQTAEKARELFPDNIPLLLESADLALKTDHAEHARQLLSSHLERADTHPDIYRHLARAESQLGNQGSSHYRMDQYYEALDEIHEAAAQIRLALRQNDLDPVQQARYKATLDRLAKRVKELDREQSRQQNGAGLRATQERALGSPRW